MKFIRSPLFDNAYRKLPDEGKNAFKKKIRLLIKFKYSHPSLRVKKMKGTDYIWEGSIDMTNRFTFEKVKGGIKVRVIGNHNNVTKVLLDDKKI